MAMIRNSVWEAFGRLGLTKIAVIVVLGVVLYQASKPVVIIEKVDVDPSIKDHLLSADELTSEIEAARSDLSAKRTIRFSPILMAGKGERPEIVNQTSAIFRLSDEQAIDFQVPTVGLSYSTIKNIIRGIISNEPTRVHIVISKNDQSDFVPNDDNPDAGENSGVRGYVRFENAKIPLDEVSGRILLPDLKAQRIELTRNIASAAAKIILQATDPLAYAIQQADDSPWESIHLLEALRPPTFWQRFTGFFPWAEQRHRVAIFHGFLGDELADAGLEPKRAEAELKQSFQLEPHPTIANNLGVFLYEKQRYPEAREWLSRAAAMLPKSSLARSMTLSSVAMTYEGQGQTDSAIALMEEAAQAWPNSDQNPAPYGELAIFYSKKNDYKRAEINAREYLRLAPWRDDAYLKLASILELEHRTQEAIEVLRIARDSFLEEKGPRGVIQNSSASMDLLGDLLEDVNGKTFEIEQAYRLAVSTLHDPDAYLILSDYLERCKRHDEAVKVLREGIEATGTQGDALRKALDDMTPGVAR